MLISNLSLFTARLWDALGIKDLVTLQINSLGNVESRAAHKDALVKYFEKHFDVLDEDSQRRLSTNPLRILDSKVFDMQALIEGAPKLSDYLKR